MHRDGQVPGLGQHSHAQCMLNNKEDEFTCEDRALELLRGASWLRSFNGQKPARSSTPNLAEFEDDLSAQVILKMAWGAGPTWALFSENRIDSLILATLILGPTGPPGPAEV